jgi:hypothetical protein
MKPHFAAVLSILALALPLPASADTLLVERVNEEAQVALPARGLSMAEVETRFGAPTDRLEPRGGEKRQWPAIDRWVYPGFTVYFENKRVIDAVLNRAGANEIGPKPAIR